MKFLIKFYLACLLVLIQTSAFSYRYNLSDLEDNLNLEDIEYIENKHGEVVPAVQLDDGSYYAVPVLWLELGSIAAGLTLLVTCSIKNQMAEDRDAQADYYKKLLQQGDIANSQREEMLEFIRRQSEESSMTGSGGMCTKPIPLLNIGMDF